MKAIIFDLFRTLTTDNGRPDIEDRIIKEFNLRLSYPEVERYTCGTLFMNMDQYLENLLAGIKVSITRKNKLLLLKLIEDDIASFKVKPGAEKTLALFKEGNYKIGLISNILTPSYNRIYNSLDKYFDYKALSFELGIIKPDTRIFQLALDKLNVTPEQAIMIGDSLESDIIGAKNAGIKGIWISDKQSTIPYAITHSLADTFKITEKYFNQK